jgi:hypothetical protein
MSSRSLRSAQARTASGIYDKRVPSLASPSSGHYASLSFVVIGKERHRVTDLGFAYAPCPMLAYWID